MLRFTVFYLFLLACAVALADEFTEADFEVAWQDYVEARDAGRTKKKLEASGRVVEIGRAILAEGDFRLAILLSNHAYALTETGQQSQAIPFFASAMEIAETAYGADSPEVIPFVLAQARALDDTDEAQPFFDRALELTADRYGMYSLEYAELDFERTSRRFIPHGESMKKKHVEDIVAFYRAAGDAASDDLAFSLLNLGRMEIRAGRTSSALDSLEEAVVLADEGKAVGLRTSLSAHSLMAQVHESRGRSGKATRHLLETGRLREASGTTQYGEDIVPISRVAPVYPPDLLRSGTQGQVDLLFTVDTEGFVRDIEVVSEIQNGKPVRKRGKSFSRAAIKAVSEFRYVPRFENGQSVETPGVETRISFQIDRF